MLAGMGDEGTLTHVLVEHGKAKNELEELQLTKSDTSKRRSSRTKAPTQEIKRREQAKRIHVEENQSLDVVKSFAESISANFTVLTESMTNSFQKLGENLNVMNDNIMSLIHWPESEFSDDISEQLDVNEVNIHTYIHKLYFSSNLRVAIIKANISEKTITKVTKYTTTLLTTILYNIYKLWLKEIGLYIKNLRALK